MSFIHYDTVILGGRVIDPETRFDGVRNVGVTDGKIAIITEKSITGKKTIDASGMVVCPGFIEAHMHASDEFTLKGALRDGLTTAMDFECGISDPATWYARHEGKMQCNYGQVACCAIARVAVLDGPDIAALGNEMATLFTRILPATAKRAKEENRPMGWNATQPDKLQMTQIMTLMDEWLRQGALGVGIPVGYMTHGITSYEMFKYQELAAKYGRLSQAHTRFAGVQPPNEGALGIQEVMCNGMVLNAPTMASHLNSIMDWEFTIPYVNQARKNGHKIIGEAYPYHAGSTTGATDILLPEGMQSLGITYENVYYVEPFERWTKEIYDKRMEDPGRTIVIENNKEEDIAKWMSDNETLVCSDGMPALNINDNMGLFPWNTPFEGHSVHPRTSGTRGKFLRLARDDPYLKEKCDMITAISRCSYLAAKYFDELAGMTHFRTKGRMQEGCDADIVVLDWDNVTDNSTYNVGEGMLPTTGIPHVMVNGVLVVENNESIEVFPGKPIRFPVLPKGKIDEIDVNPPVRPEQGKNTRHIEHMGAFCC